ncbi:hypothetical protein ABFS83_03G019600 [Erythranthe nasuta]
MINLVRRNLGSYIVKSHVSFSTPLRFFSSSSSSSSSERQQLLRTNPKVFDILLHRHHFTPELASRVASALAHLKTPEKADSVLSFFKESGFSNTRLEKIVKYRPRLLSASLEASIKPKIRVFQDLGFSSDDISIIISSNPAILHLSVNNNIIPTLSLLKGLLGSDYDLARLLRLSAWFVTTNLEQTMVPNFDFLKSFGIPMERLFLILHSYPRFFLLKPDILRRSVDKAEEMGIDRCSKVFIYAVRSIASMSNEAWELKLQGFRDLGFSESEILAMFVKAPSAFSGSMVKIKKVKEVLLGTGKFSMSCIVNNPMSLACSIERRFKPRIRILEILERRNLITNWPGLGKVYTLTDEKFFQKFISPYMDEVSDVYVPMSSVRGRRLLC